MTKKGFAKISLPPHTWIHEALERDFLETGRLQAVEINPTAIVIWDSWESSDELMKSLTDHFPGVQVEREFVPDQDWNLTWIDGFKPRKIGHLWVTPPWHMDKIPPGESVVCINPGSAFGTGTHESTRLSLMMLQRYIKQGQSVLDLGCGSGILSIAASLLGASPVVACDVDPQIETNIRENIELNGNPPIRWDVCDVFKLNTYACDWAMINIQKPVIFPLLEKFSTLSANRKADHLILAGLLIEDEKELKRLLSEAGYRVTDKQTDGEWLAICATRNVL
ncbi:MAG: 50S ribosomal protein L11 methyltransferase [Candidatus Marinimicrobia bacterium]|nr:50S ribosomal protein L11 methyltransferase [Candidatus Neomarinimicrobiota bacterium]